MESTAKVEDSTTPERTAAPDPSKSTNKRKRKPEQVTVPLHTITEVFLRIIYPLNVGMEKSVVVGIVRSLDYQVGVSLHCIGKSILLNAKAWNSLTSVMDLLKCYISHYMNGRKTSVLLTESDIEVDVVKLRNNLCVRFRDLTKHDSKMILSTAEFFMLKSVTPAVNRYIDQLEQGGTVIRDYLETSIDKDPKSPLLLGAVDTGLYNRLPHEVMLYRNSIHLPCDRKLENSSACDNEDEVEDQVSGRESSDDAAV